MRGRKALLFLRMAAAAGIFGLGSAPFEFHELAPDAAGAGRVLPALQFTGGAALEGFAFAEALELGGEQFPGGEAVGGLGAVLLHFEEDVFGWVAELDAGGDFVDVLAARAARVDEAFLHARGIAAEGGEVGAQVLGREGAHALPPVRMR